MPSAMYGSRYITSLGAMIIPVDRGRVNMNRLVALSRQLLPTDSIGNVSITLSNMVVGSRLHIRSQDGTVVHYDGVVLTATETKILPVYSGGSARNDWRIRVRKSTSAPFYRNYETLLTVAVGTASIYVVQEADQ